MKETDILKVFGSKCRAKLLEKFFLEYESGNNEGFHMRALSRDLGEQINSIKRELDMLEEVGILGYKDELKRKVYFVNPKFPLIYDFTNIFLKSYNPMSKIKEYFKNKSDLELVIINESVKSILVSPGKSILDIFLIGEIDKENLQNFFSEIFYGRKVKYAIISTQDFFKRLEFGDKLVKNILENEGNIYLKDSLKIREKLGI